MHPNGGSVARPQPASACVAVADAARPVARARGTHGANRVLDAAQACAAIDIIRRAPVPKTGGHPRIKSEDMLSGRSLLPISAQPKGRSGIGVVGG